MQKSSEARIVLFTKLYTAVSKATAETTDHKGRVQKTIFRGSTKDLFKDVSPFTITRFLWAISHKTDVLPTVLFRITDHGNKGCEIERAHTGFIPIDSKDGKKVVGTDLIPYIIEATKFYKTTPRVVNPAVTKVPVKKANNEQVFDCSRFSDDLLAVAQKAIATEIARREEQRKLVAEVQELCELKGISFEDLYKKIQIVKSLM